MKRDVDAVETPWAAPADPAPTPLLDTSELNGSFYRAVIAQFLATPLFLYISVATIIGHGTSGSGGVGIHGIAWAFGGMVFLLVCCIAGGHLNPAVTFALLLTRKVTLLRAVAYMVAQCLGAICGVALVKGVYGSFDYTMCGGGANSVHPGFRKGAGLGAEILGTFVLMATVFFAIDPKRKAREAHIPVLAPLAIRFAVFVVILATAPVTGTGINPARSLDPAVIYNQRQTWSDHWIFWVGPFLGAAAAALCHQYVLGAGVRIELGSFDHVYNLC